MSISDRHTVSLFQAGKSQALTDQRLAKVGFKLTQKMKDAGITAVPASICVSLPLIADSDITPAVLADLMPHLKEILYKAQDALIAREYEKRGEKFIEESIAWDDISISKCIDYLDEQETGGRLTVAILEDWFNKHIHASLTEYLTIKASGKLEGDALKRAVRNSVVKYREQVSALSGGATHYAAPIRAQLLSVLGLVSDEGESIAAKLVKRIEAMERKDMKDAADVGLIAMD